MVLQPLPMRFNQFLDQSGVNQRIYELLDRTDIDDVSQLWQQRARRSASGYRHSLFQPGWKRHHAMLCTAFVRMMKMPSLPCVHSAHGGRCQASFAGQRETFLNVQGFDLPVLVAVKHVF